MEDVSVEDVPKELPLKRQARKKPDLSGVEPKEITIQTKKGEKTFTGRSRKKVEFEQSAPPPPSNPWSSVMNSWLD